MTLYVRLRELTFDWDYLNEGDALSASRCQHYPSTIAVIKCNVTQQQSDFYRVIRGACAQTEKLYKNG